MPACPHCGEPYHRGQDRCYACGQRIRTRAVGKKAPVNPIVYIIAAGALVLGVIGFIIFMPTSRKEAAATARQAERERVRDSVRQANRVQLADKRESDQTDRMRAELVKIEERFDRVQEQVVVGHPSPEQSRIIGQIRAELSSLTVLASKASFASDEERSAVEDSFRTAGRKVRGLISDLTRAPRNKITEAKPERQRGRRLPPDAKGP